MLSVSKKAKKLPKYLTKTKIDEMLERARNDNKRNYLILLTLWRTGIRNSELVNLRKRDIKFEENRVVIHQGKGNKDRWIPLDTALADLLSYHIGDISLDDVIFPLSTAQISGIFRDKIMSPPLLGDYLTWAKDKKCSITFKGVVYGKDDLSITAWHNIVHEVTHYEEHITSVMVAGYMERAHSKKFKELLKINLKKVDDLRKQFNKEVGWDEDFVYGGTKMGYYYIELLAKITTENDANDGGCDEVMERIQFAIDEIAKECNVLLVKKKKKEEISNNMR